MADILDELIKREEGESANAFRAFLEFARLPVSSRIEGICLAEISKRTGLAESTVKYNRGNYNWDSRISMLDAEVFKREFQQRAALLAKDNEKIIEETRFVKKSLLSTLRKGADLLEAMVDDALESKDFKVKDIAPLLNAISKNTRLVNDLPTEIIETKLVSQSDLSGMTTEEIQATMQKIREERMAQSGIQKISEVQ